MFMMIFFITSRLSLYCTDVTLENSFILFTSLAQHFSHCCLPVIIYIGLYQYTILNPIKSVKFIFKNTNLSTYAVILKINKVWHLTLYWHEIIV